MTNFDDYQTEAMRLALPQSRNLTYMILGLTNEAGEAAGKVKKMFRGDSTLQQMHEGLAAELGDALWYLAGCAHQIGFSLSQIAQQNIEKLHKRQLLGTLRGNGDNR